MTEQKIEPKKTKRPPRVSGFLGCLGCLGIAIILAFVVFIYPEGPIGNTGRSVTTAPTHRQPNTRVPPAPPKPMEKLDGKFLSESGTAEYTLKHASKEFHIFTKIEGSFRPNTHIKDFELRVVEADPLVVELIGADQQAGGHPETTLRITLQTDGRTELIRMRPLGGRIGTFRKAD